MPYPQNLKGTTMDQIKNDEETDAIILIHGIGAQNPRSTLDQFLKGSEKETPFLTFEQHIVTPQEDSKHDFNLNQTFSYFSHKVSHKEKPTTIAEMYWNDFSQLTTQWPANLRNFFSLIKNAPDIIYAAFAPDDNLPNSIQLLLKVIISLTAFAFWLIYYPIVMLNLAFYWHSLNLYLTPKLYNVCVEFLNWIAPKLNWMTDEADKLQRLKVEAITDNIQIHFYIASTIVFVLLLIMGQTIVRKQKNKKSQKEFHQSQSNNMYQAHVLIGTGLVILATILIIGYKEKIIGTSQEFQDIAELMTFVISSSWFSVLLIHAIIFVLLFCIILPFFPTKRKGILLGLATTHLTIRFWLVLFTTAALALIYGTYSDKLLEKVDQLLIDSMAFLSLFWADISILALIALFTVLKHAILTKKRFQHKDKSTDYPRLIIPNTLAYTAITLSGLFFALIFICACLMHQSHQYLPFDIPRCSQQSYCTIIADITKNLIYIFPFFLLIGPLLIRLTHTAFEVAGDVVNVFKAKGMHRDLLPWHMFTSAYQYTPDKNRVLPPQLRARLKAIITDIKENNGPINSLTIVSHSLGTMIALDAIKTQILNGQASKVKLIIMGCPMTNIFENYFPNSYGQDKGWEIPNTIKTINFYRANDYVGNKLSGSLNIKQQIPYSPKGHFGYFSDTEICKEIWKFHSS